MAIARVCMYRTPLVTASLEYKAVNPFDWSE